MTVRPKAWLIIGFLLAAPVVGWSQQVSLGPDAVGLRLSLEGENFTRAVNIFLLITALSLAPAFVMMMTSFTRIVVVLSFLRQALGTQQAPSAKIITSLALFLTFFIMQPIWQEIYQESVVAFSQGEITEAEAFRRAEEPIKRFMISQTREQSLLLFMDLVALDTVSTDAEVPLQVVIPAFMVSELQTAFQMGFLIYLPFLVIDAVVATFLMSMGMMMLPPMMISLPFKLLLFIMVDGWTLIVRAVVSSFA